MARDSWKSWASLRDPDKPDLELRSRTSGRERWLVRSLAGNEAFARSLEQELLSHPGVLEARANPNSSRVLIKYIPGTPGLDTGLLLEQCVRKISSSPPMAQGEVIGAPVSERAKAAPTDSWFFRFIIFLTGRKAPSDAEGGEPSNPLAEALQIGLPQPKVLIGPVALSVASQGLNFLRGLCFVNIVNAARGESLLFLRPLGVSSGPRFVLLAVTSFLVVAADYVVGILRRRSWHSLGEITTLTLRNEVYSQILHQDLEVFDQLSKSAMTQVIDRDTHHIGQLVARGGDTLVSKGIVLLVAGTSLFTASPMLLGFVSLLVPLLLLPSRLLAGRISEQEQRFSEAEIEFNRTIDNSLSNIVNIKSFSAEDREIFRFFESSAELASSATETDVTSALESRGVDTILVSGWYVMASFTGSLASKGEIDQARYSWLLFLMPRLLDAPANLEEITRIYNKADRGARNLTSILTIEPRIESGPRPLPIEDVRGDVVFDRVSFGYSEDQTVIKDISFELHAGQTCAIVGPTGSGKSTLLRLLTRLYDVNDGFILIDGHDIRELQLGDLRSAIGLVTQDAYLFEGTIRENVQYGRPDATEDEILAALEAASAIEIVERLPGGLDAPLGERGGRLSGGQRQRIALARTLLKAAPILALDEATSQLDYETEAAIQQSLRQEISETKKSAMVVAHRLATIRHADQILVLEDGRITERGVHDTLVTAGGLYQVLWELQVGVSPIDRGLLEVRIRSDS